MMIPILQVLLCGASITLASVNSPYWWIAVIPWCLLCITGILLSIPILLVVGMVIGGAAGGAQADWMSDGFIFTVIFVFPTILSVITFFSYRRIREARLARHKRRWKEVLHEQH